MKNFLMLLILLVSLAASAQCPQITVQPISMTTCSGTIATFSMQAMGSNLSYQWYHDGQVVIGAITPTFFISFVMPSDAGSYSCHVSAPNCATVMTIPVPLIVDQTPQITMQPPASSQLCAGQSAFFSITATGTNISYQWYFNNSPVPDANSNTLIVPNVNAASQGNYYCVISNPSCPSVVSSYGQLTVYIPPVIVTPLPAQTMFCPGQSVTLCANATGQNLAYQWMIGTTVIAGATTACFTLNPANDSDASIYSCSVSNFCGATFTETELVSNCLSVPDLQNLEVGIYPNPVHGFLNINSNADLQKMKFTLVDLLGRQSNVALSGFNGNNGKIDVNGFAKGIYILKIGLDAKSIFRKFIID